MSIDTPPDAGRPMLPQEARQLLAAAGRVQRRADSPEAWASLRRMTLWAGPMLIFSGLASALVFVREVGPSDVGGPMLGTHFAALAIIGVADAARARQDVVVRTPKLWTRLFVVAVLCSGAMLLSSSAGGWASQLRGLAAAVVVAVAAWLAFVIWLGRRTDDAGSPRLCGAAAVEVADPVPHRLALRLLLAVVVAGMAMPQSLTANVVASVAIALLGLDGMLRPEFGMASWTDDWGRADVRAAALSGWLSAAGVLASLVEPGTWLTGADEDAGHSRWTHVGGPLVVLVGVVAALPLLWRVAASLRGRRKVAR